MIKFRDSDEDMPAARSNEPDESEEESFDLAPEPMAPPRSPADRGSIAGQSRAGRSGSTAALDLGAKRAAQSTSRDKPPLDDSADNDDFGDVLDIKEPAPKEDDGDAFNFAIPSLPPVITRTLLPWAIVIVCLGGAGYDAVSHVLELPGKAVGLSIVGAALLLYSLLLVPLTLRSIYSAAITAKLSLPDVAWFQTFSLLALPTAGMVVGYYAGGTGPMITLGVLGLVVMAVPMAFMFRADVIQTLLTAFYAASTYVASGALCAAILIGLGLVLDHSRLVVPWKSELVIVAKVDKPPAIVVVPDTSSAAPVVAPAIVAPKPVEAPVVQPAPAPVVPTGPAWHVPVEPLAAAAWPIPQNEIHESIEVITPVTTVHSTGGGPFVALLQPRTTAIYDLRTGKRGGFIKAAFQPRTVVLSPDGTMLAGSETTQSQGSSIFSTDGVAGAIEIWSALDNRLLGQVPSGQSAVVPAPLGFAGGKLIAFGSSNGISGLQEWDPASGLILHQWRTPPLSRNSLAISNSGKYVAVAVNPVIRVFDTQSGEIAGELSSPVALSQTTGMAFSSDGKTIAAIVPSGGSNGVADSGAMATLLEWNVADGGKLARTVPIDLTTAASPFDPSMASSAAVDASDVAYLQWTPDGRMVRVGDGLFEATTGKAIFTLPNQTSGNLNGKLIAVADKRSAYEFLPTGTGSRLILKTVDLPNATIASAITSAAKNEMAATAPTAVSSGTQLAGTSPPAGATLAASSTGVSAMVMSPPVASPPSHRRPARLLMRRWNLRCKGNGTCR